MFLGHVKQAISTPSEREHCGTTTEHDLQYKSNSVVYADCNSSNRGLFAGKIWQKYFVYQRNELIQFLNSI